MNQSSAPEWTEYRRQEGRLRRPALLGLGTMGMLFLLLPASLRSLVPHHPAVVIAVMGSALLLSVLAALALLVGGPLIRLRYHPNRFVPSERRYDRAALVFGPVALLALAMAAVRLVPGPLANAGQGRGWALVAVVAFGVPFVLKPRDPR